MRGLLGVAVVVALALAACARSAPPPAAPARNTPAPTAPPAAPAPADPFVAAAAARGFAYAPPAGFAPVAIVDNRDVAYDHAIESADGQIQVRYALRPYAADHPVAMRSAQFSWTFFVTAIMNITQAGSAGQASDGDEVPAADFHADDARLILVRLTSDRLGTRQFGAGFTGIVIMYLHREGFGDAYTFALFRELAALERIREPLMQSLTFAPAPL